MTDDGLHHLTLTTDELFALGEAASVGSRNVSAEHKRPSLAAMEKLLALMVECAEEKA